MVDRIEGDRGCNLEEAIACFLAALQVWTLEEEPLEWAKAHLNLGYAMSDRIFGDERLNIEQAIEYYYVASKVYEDKNAIIAWAETQCNLGFAIHNRIEGDRMQNCEQAMACYHAALLKLEDLNETMDSGILVPLYRHLGIAYRTRVAGNRKRNIENAIEYFRIGLGMISRVDDPEIWAELQGNLGSAFADRIQGDREENSKAAVGHIRAALQEWTRRSAPDEWPKAQVRLADALLKSHPANKSERDDNVQKAIECYTAALNVWEERGELFSCSQAHANLGDIYVYEGKESTVRKGNIEEGIRHYVCALEYWTPLSAPYRWRQVCEDMADAYLKLAELEVKSRDSPKEQHENALEYFELSLSSLTIKEDPKRFLYRCRQRAKMLAYLGKDDEALEAIEKCMEALKHARISTSDGLLLSVQLEEQNGKLGALHISLLLGRGDVIKKNEVVTVCESSQAALLYSMIGSAKVPEEKIGEFEEARRKVIGFKHQLDSFIGGKTEYDRLHDAYEHAEQNMQKIVAASRTETAENCVDEEYGKVVGTDALLGFLRDTEAMGLLFFFGFQYDALASGKQSMVLYSMCLWEGKVHISMHPEITDIGAGHKACTFLNLNEVTCEMDAKIAERRRKVEEVYLKGLGCMIRKIFDEAGITRTPKKLVIVPHRGLHKIPFSAIPIACDGETKFLGDVVSEGIWTAPNLSICKYLHERGSRRVSSESRDALRVVSVTSDDLDTSTPFSKSVKKAFGPKTKRVLLKGREAEPEKVLASGDVRKCDVLNINCHGRFADVMGKGHVSRVDTDKVLNMSGLLLGGKLLSMLDIWKMRLGRCRVACVVACSGGVVDTGSDSDQSLSVGSGFLVAGAQHTVCALWPVHQVVAVLVMLRFYENLRRGGEFGRFQSGSMSCRGATMVSTVGSGRIC